MIRIFEFLSYQIKAILTMNGSLEDRTEILVNLLIGPLRHHIPDNLHIGIHEGSHQKIINGIKLRIGRFLLTGSNGTDDRKIHTSDIAILIRRSGCQDSVIDTILQTFSFQLRSTTDIDNTHLTTDTGIPHRGIHEGTIQIGHSLSRLCQFFLIVLLGILEDFFEILGVSVILFDQDKILTNGAMIHRLQIIHDQFSAGVISSQIAEVILEGFLRFICELIRILQSVKHLHRRFFQEEIANHSPEVIIEMLLDSIHHRNLNHHDRRIQTIGDEFVIGIIDGSTQSIIKVRSNENDGHSSQSRSILHHSQNLFDHSPMGDVIDIVVEEDGSCITYIRLEFLGIGIGVILEHNGIAIKPIPILNLHRSLKIISDIDIDGRIVSLQIDLLDHRSNLLIAICGGIGNPIDVFHISILLNGVNITTILEHLDDGFLCSLQILQKILLPHILELIRLGHIANKLIRSHDGRCRAISNLRDQIERDGLDEGEETIGQGIIEKNPIGNRPTILGRIPIGSIINDGGMCIRP